MADINNKKNRDSIQGENYSPGLLSFIFRPNLGSIRLLSRLFRQIFQIFTVSSPKVEVGATSFSMEQLVQLEGVSYGC